MGYLVALFSQLAPSPVLRFAILIVANGIVFL